MMKKVISTLLAGAIGVSMMVPAFAAETDSMKIYVSATSGDDAANGATINSAVKTPARAQEIARTSIAEGKKVEVIFEKGEYIMEDTLAFTSEDNGSTYRAYQGADVKFTLATKLTADNFTAYDANIMMADLTEASGGLADVVYQLGEMQKVGSTRVTAADFDVVELPNDEGVMEVVAYKLTEDQQAKWGGKTGIKVGYMQNQYSYTIGDFNYAEEDPTKMFTPPTTGAMDIMNVLAEVDEPGEYYVDATEKKLYYYPKYTIEDAPVYVANKGSVKLTNPGGGADFTITGGGVVYINGAEDIAFEGIDLFCGLAGFVIFNSDNITIYDSSITGFGEYGVHALGATNLKVLASRISDMKKGGIYDVSRITSPHKYTGTNPVDAVIPEEQVNLISSGNIIRNTSISNYGKVYKTAAAGIDIENVGTTVANCEIHDAPFRAISFTGNDHVIENNKIYNVIQSTWDSGAIYSMRSWIGRGTVIRNNFIYQTPDKGDYSKITNGLWYNSGTENQAIYLDDLQSGITVDNNIIYNMSNAIMAGGGSDHVITNNVAVNCRSGIVYDNQGAGGWRMQHINPDAEYQGKVYWEVMGFIEGGYDATTWGKYSGFAEMIERINTYNAVYNSETATSTEKTEALKVLGRVYNRTVNNNIYTGPWAEWSIGEYTPEGADGKANGATWTDSTGTQWKNDNGTYKLLKSDSWVGPTQQFAMSTAYDSDDTNANTAMTTAAAGITILADGNITVGSRTTADMGVKADSYTPSYSPDEDGVNKGNKFTAVAAVYDASGELKAVNKKKDSFMQNGQLANIEVEVPEGATGDWQVKLLLWDSLNGLTPIADGNVVLQ